MTAETPLLDTLNDPHDLKALSSEQLEQLSHELRLDVIHKVSQTGGHFGANLGVIELTVALHHVFNTPNDRLIWDVGHQSYPHKILTKRRHAMGGLRQGGGISGFPRRCESEYDAFGTAHSSTSISAALGMAVARDHLNHDNNVIAVIGDGAMSAGMAYEAMNNAGALKSKLIVILNDNDMSISRPVGAMSNYLSRLISSRPYHKLRKIAKETFRHLPKPIEDIARRAEEYARGLMTGGTLFEELGFYYIGPLDGHNLDHLIPILKNVRDAAEPGPYLIHVITEKGRGYAPAEAAPDKLHAIAKFEVSSGQPFKPSESLPSYTKVFAEQLVQEAYKDPKLIAITAAMPSGTGLDLFAKHHPDRCYDVGIAEQHAVTFAAGLACEGLNPVVAIYSTFLQRAYDQVVHDVALQNLPVKFVMDRAGLVGADGATHAGSFDIAYLGCLPNMVLMAPSDGEELRSMLSTLVSYNDSPSALRFPRGDIHGALNMDRIVQPIPIGKARIIQEGTDIALISYGTRLYDCQAASLYLKEQFGLSITIIDARFAKPLDEDLLVHIAREHSVVLTIEEGAVGGFGSMVSHLFSNRGLFDKGLIFRSLTLPDRFQDHDTQAKQLEDAGLSPTHVTKEILRFAKPYLIEDKKFAS
ncbi:MAG: 1-deoxy-D-xylulose-5-phosphate synthase [Alphaproteobacteria bacterium]|nr:1-deoxy-D-xylulose-5-phosphate synthase [Alphaproteobacteria bacterium]OJV45681.1 MAG: 1-deoxy-D-xylulose-5-phosphate synthase [Alphaproteobacteria bacterium 43-37]